MNEKFILDACCGGRMFWFNKAHPNVLYIDSRRAGPGLIKERPNFCVDPDVIMDFRCLNFPDKSFKLVVFDPPHLLSPGPNSIMRKRYGGLGPSWRDDLQAGFEECWRVLDDFGVLIFKWSEVDVKKGDVLALFGVRPLFGHQTGSRNKTHWLCFMKIPGAKGLR